MLLVINLLDLGPRLAAMQTDSNQSQMAAANEISYWFHLTTLFVGQSIGKGTGWPDCTFLFASGKREEETGCGLGLQVCAIRCAVFQSSHTK